MILLTNSTDILQVYSSDALALEISVNYVDLNLQTRLQAPGRKNIIITASGVSEIITGSSSYGVSRAVKQLSIYNGDPANATAIEIQHSGLHEGETVPTVVTQYAVTLAADQIAQYTTGNGFDKQGDRTQGNDFIGAIGDFLKFNTTTSVEAVSPDDLKRDLNLGDLQVNESGDLVVSGGITLEGSPTGTIDLGGGAIINGSIDGGVSP